MKSDFKSKISQYSKLVIFFFTNLGYFSVYEAYFAVNIWVGETGTGTLTLGTKIGLGTSLTKDLIN